MPGFMGITVATLISQHQQFEIFFLNKLNDICLQKLDLVGQVFECRCRTKDNNTVTSDYVQDTEQNSNVSDIFCWHQKCKTRLPGDSYGLYMLTHVQLAPGLGH